MSPFPLCAGQEMPRGCGALESLLWIPGLAGERPHTPLLIAQPCPGPEGWLFLNKLWAVRVGVGALQGSRTSSGSSRSLKERTRVA